MDILDFRMWLEGMIEYHNFEANKIQNMSCPNYQQSRHEDMALAFEECLEKLNEMEE